MEDAMLLADEIQFSSPTLNMRSERINTNADGIIDVATDPAGNGEHVQIPRSLVKRNYQV